MGKKRQTSKQSKKIENQPYVFYLKGNNNTYYNETVICDFKPIYSKSKKIYINTHPCFNKDKKYYTPTFKLMFNELDNEELLKDHQKKLNDYASQKQEILIPKPRSRSMFCSVCKKIYEDYLEHIQSKRHKQIAKKHKVQRQIKDLCKKFRDKNGIELKINNQNSDSESVKYDEKQSIAQTTGSSSQISRSLSEIDTTRKTKSIFQRMGIPL